MRTKTDTRGFTLAEVLIVIALLGILASIVVLNFGGSDRPANERALRANLQSLRSAIALYKADHGHWPCSQADYSYPCSQQEFEYKLLRYTNKAGRWSTTISGASSTSSPAA